ncbi:MAG: type II secretion system protein M [Nitrospinae bacterium]|nr:type II secretion system protein M [Nitrospinota bacterium]
MILQTTNKRNKILFAVAGVLLIWFAVGMVITPIMDSFEEQNRRIKEAKADLQKITDLSNKYIAMMTALPPSMRAETAGVSIQETVGKISRGLSMEKNIERMVPGFNPKEKEETLAVTITGLPYPVLVDFLRGVYESGATISASRAKITTMFDNRNNVSAEIMFVMAK